MNVLCFQQANVVDQGTTIKIGMHNQFRHFYMTLTLILDTFVVFTNNDLIFKII